MGACGSKERAVQAGPSPATRETKEEKPTVVTEQKKPSKETKQSDDAAVAPEKAPQKVRRT